MSDVVPANPKPLFSKKAHELAKLVRELKKVSKRAVEVLEEGLSSQDERVRMIAAEKLLGFYRSVANDIKQAEIKDLLLDIRVNGLIGQGSTTEEDDTPALDFDNIAEEFRDNVTVVDMGDVNKI